MSEGLPSFGAATKRTKEYGVIEVLRHPLVLVRGLPGARPDEIVLFENGQEGYVLSLAEDLIEVVTLSDERLGLGEKVARTDMKLTIPVGDGLRGKMIDPLGRVLSGDSSEALAGKLKNHELDVHPPQISKRHKITTQLETGSSLVDMMRPLGLGQRQAVLGDQKTGKTSFLFSAVRAHAAHDLVVFAVIGKPQTAITEAYSFVQGLEHRENVIMVATRANDVSSMVVLTPFAAMTIAGHYVDLGHNVLVVLDDLTTHANYYREMSLLGRRFPGRESYPGDIFHLHARLLERAGNFSSEHNEKGESSITCLPVAETVRSDLTGYIVSNLISITDGHLLFDAGLFSQGRRPAINLPLSVTRVGAQTQERLDKKLNRKLNEVLHRYEKAANYAHFGAELSPDVALMLDTGAKLQNFFSQPPFLTVPHSVQLLVAGMIWKGWLEGLETEAAGQFRDRMVQHYTGNQEVNVIVERVVATEELPVFEANLEAAKARLMDLCQSEMITKQT